MRSFRPYFSLGKCFLALAGSAILAFGLYNVHSFSNVTEGGVLGMTLLLHHWLGLSPSISGLVLNAACYIGGWRTLGRSFIFYSVIAGGGFSAFYAFFERFDPLWPGLAQMPLVAAVVGALFVAPGATRQGIGRALLDEVKQHYAWLSLEVYQKNESAVSFYHAQGFRIEDCAWQDDTQHPTWIMRWPADQMP